MSISPPSRHAVVAVTGASGGLGASTLATAVALAAPRGEVTLVDADLAGGGLDATAGVEHVDGLRWSALVEHDGRAAGGALRARLPAGRVPVLAARGPAPDDRTACEVVGGLASVTPVVVDLPRTRATDTRWLGLLDALVLVVGLRPRWLRDAQAARDGLAGVADRVVLVTRGSRRPGAVPERVADHLGLALLEHLPDDPGVVRDESRGRPPGRHGPTAAVARAVLEVARLDPGMDLRGAA